jgi:hypothetical protein
MLRLTEQDNKVLMLSKLEEEWSISRVATHNGLSKSTVLQIISKEEVGTRRDRGTRPILIFLIAVNVTFNLISKLPVHTA